MNSTVDLDAYQKFLEEKVSISKDAGCKCTLDDIHPLLKPHQKAIVQWAVNGGRRAIFASFGLGKSLMQLEVCRIITKHLGPQSKALIVCPLGVRQEFAHDAAMIGLRTCFIQSMDDLESSVNQKELIDLGTPIYVTNYESVRSGKLDPRGFEVVSLDEACFPAGTMVETPKGSVAIDSLRIGDTILNASGTDVVKAVHKKKVTHAVKINGKIIASPEHDFFTQRGFVHASELRPGDSLVETSEAMRLLREDISSEVFCGSEAAFLQSVLQSEWNPDAGSEGKDRCHKEDARGVQVANQPERRMEAAEEVRVVRRDVLPENGQRTRPAFLREPLFRQVANEPAMAEGHYRQGMSHARSSPEGREGKIQVACIGTSEGRGRETEAQRFRTIGGSPQAAINRQDAEEVAGPNILGERRKRQDYCAAGIPCGGFESADGVRDRNGECEGAIPVPAELLQGRSCGRETEGGYRSGRRESPHEKVAFSRQAENGDSGRVRVDSVEVLEQGYPDLERLRNADGSLYFYDISATRHPSYSVEGVLVHNCILRGGGSVLTFRTLMGLFEGTSTYRFVATATPDPNQYDELLYYADFLGVMERGDALTRFFKRDSTKADNLTLHANKAEEFWLWVSTWACFLATPSDLGEGYSDDGYILPPMTVNWHELPANNDHSVPDRDGQLKMWKDAAAGLSESAAEKRDSLENRIAKMKEIVAASPHDHFLIWCDLEDERKAIHAALPECTSVYGTQKQEDKEAAVAGFANGTIQYLSSKASMLGQGCNFQKHCHRAIFVGIGYKFALFAQAMHRIYRFLQDEQVTIDIIYTEAEAGIRDVLLSKWERHKKQLGKMAEIIREHGLASASKIKALTNSMGIKRVEDRGENWRLVNNDTVLETAAMKADSVNLIVTSIPFSFQYSYSTFYADFGQSDSNDNFWAQMDFLTPNLLRVLAPGRVCCIHVKDRIVPGGLTGLGFQTLSPFHCEAIMHYMKHGFAFLGMKTVTTDVVRENNQTYRLGWSEQCKDGSRMGCGVPEYVLLFRKPPSDLSNGYADDPVVKEKPQTEFPDGTIGPYDYDGGKAVPGTGYSRARWQLDAHGYMRCDGNRLLSSEEMATMPHAQIFRRWKEQCLGTVYDFNRHVELGEELEREKRLPSTFMVMPPHSPHPDVWTDIARMRTLNMVQKRTGHVMHVCPLQEHIIQRLINQFSMPGEVVYDPFDGIGSVAYWAVKMKRFGLGTELNVGYHADAVLYCTEADKNKDVPTLFDALKEDEDEPEVEAPVCAEE